jgi:hypothetical protein
MAMTESPLPPDADAIDLAASAIVDASPAGDGGDDLDEAVLAARVEAFRQVATSVGAGITNPPSSVIDHHIGVAIEVLERDGVPDAIPLAPRQTSWSSRRWLAIAAAVALIALALPIFNSLRDQPAHDQFAATGAAVTGSAADGSGSGPRAGVAGPDSSSTPTSGGGTPGVTGGAAPDQTPSAAASLGEVATEDQLVSLAVASLPAGSGVHGQAPPTAASGPLPSTTLVDAPTTTLSSTPPPAPAPRSSPCDATIRASYPELAPPLLVTSVTLQGVYLEVLVYASDVPGSSSYRLIAVGPADCRIVVDRLI